MRVFFFWGGGEWGVVVVVVERERERESDKKRKEKMVVLFRGREVSMKRKAVMMHSFPASLSALYRRSPFSFPCMEGNITSSSIRKRAVLS